MNKFFCFEFRFFFVSDVKSEVGFWPFWLMFPGLGASHKIEVFC